MSISETLEAVAQNQRDADENVSRMVRLIAGRLRSSRRYHTAGTGSALAELKRELRDFNLRTYDWRSV